MSPPALKQPTYARVPPMMFCLSIDRFANALRSEAQTAIVRVLALIMCCCLSVSVAQSQECLHVDQFFKNEVWAKVGERTCVRCHHREGDAAESQFHLLRTDEAGWLQNNQSAFARMAALSEGDHSVLLLKVEGGLEHGGGRVLPADSTGLRILKRYVAGFEPKYQQPAEELALDHEATPFFEGVTMIQPAQLLRRVALSLCGRLPTSDEMAAVDAGGLAALDPIVVRMLDEEGFYERLKEGFNDIFLTIGIEDNAETLLSYDHFEHTRLWYQKHDLSHIAEAEQQRARWKLADVYRDALLREPLELIDYIVRNNRPFTELATADYIMVSPYTARGYGIFDEVKHQFKDAENPFEYIPVQLKALKNRSGKTQESLTGMYPHAGFLSMFHYLRRYPSTETNRNRLRARMVYQHFLGVDIMQLAPRSTDASAVAAKYEIPTMQAADCVVCHRIIDPLAGVLQDFDFEGHLGPRKNGWYQDMFAAGFEGEDMPSSERWRAPQWLGERVVKDRRFPIAMVEHVYYLLFGRKVLQLPDDIEDSMFNAKRHAYLAQRRMIAETAEKFVESGFNLKNVFRSLIASEFYRADGLALAIEHPERRAVMDDLGVVRLLGPEQLKRKLKAIFGRTWGRLDGEMTVLYGGIDSITVTERNTDPSGAMGAIQRMMANDVACYHVARDFNLDPELRVLFPRIESDTLPGDEHSDHAIRQAIIYLHQRILGEIHTPEHPEVDRTFELFCGILADAKSQGKYEPRETYFCGGREEFRVEDPHYTVRAWRGVVTYLLRQHQFLYE